jgi:hypothetical protein
MIPTMKHCPSWVVAKFKARSCNPHTGRPLRFLFHHDSVVANSQLLPLTKLTSSNISRSPVLSLVNPSCNYRPCTGPRQRNQPAGLPVVRARRSPMLPRPSPAPSARPWHPNLPQRSYHLSKSLFRVPFRSRNHPAPPRRPPSLLPQHNRHPPPPRPPLHRPRRPLAVVHRAGLRRKRSLHCRMRHMPTAWMIRRHRHPLYFIQMRRRSSLGHALT